MKTPTIQFDPSLELDPKPMKWAVLNEQEEPTARFVHREDAALWQEIIKARPFRPINRELHG